MAIEIREAGDEDDLEVEVGLRDMFLRMEGGGDTRLA